MKYWLMKSEPTTFGIDDLIACPKKTDHWDGIRNYQARNMMRDEMKKGDHILFYHSNCKPPGVVGTMKVVEEAYPDHTAFDPHSAYYDPKSSEQNPRWFMVDVQFKKKLSRLIPLDELRQNPTLSTMQLLKRGNRLSITPVTKEEWDAILDME